MKKPNAFFLLPILAISMFLHWIGGLVYDSHFCQKFIRFFSGGRGIFLTGFCLGSLILSPEFGKFFKGVPLGEIGSLKFHAITMASVIWPVSQAAVYFRRHYDETGYTWYSCKLPTPQGMNNDQWISVIFTAIAVCFTFSSALHLGLFFLA